MSGFDKDWLTLREPVDRQARASSLVDELAQHLEASAAPSILDIGCGTGSTWRSLASDLPAATRWTLLDYDPLLLLEAERRIGVGTVSFRQFDLNEVEALPLSDVTVVTASALFDLCSAAFCDRFCALLGRAGTGLYAALNYDGVMTWSVRHPLDAQVVEDFNRHQHFDKGLGPALGPDATEYLRQSLEYRGYRVHIDDSPWVMGPANSSLQEAFLLGLEKPMSEIGNLTQAEIGAWLKFRLSAISQNNSSCVVGHTDILALPGC
jgi:SAM-dependent methyltransferase